MKHAEGRVGVHRATPADRLADLRAARDAERAQHRAPKPEPVYHYDDWWLVRYREGGPVMAVLCVIAFLVVAGAMFYGAYGR